MLVGCNGSGGLNGNLNLNYGARLAGVAPEAPALLQLREAPQKTTGLLPPLDTLVASLGRVTAPVNEAEVRRI